MKTLRGILCAYLLAVAGGCRFHHSQMSLPSDLSGTWEMVMSPQAYKYLITFDRIGESRYRLSSTNGLVFNGTYELKNNRLNSVQVGGKLVEVVWHVEDDKHLLLSRARYTADPKNYNCYVGTRLDKVSEDEIRKKRPLTNEELLNCARRHVAESEECQNVMAQMTRNNHPIETNVSPDGLTVMFMRNDLTANGSMYEIEVRMNYDGTLVNIRSQSYPLSSAVCTASDVRATLEPSTNRDGHFTIHITNVSSNTIRFLDIREGAGNGGNIYQIVVAKDGKVRESGDTCVYSGPGVPEIVSLNPGRTFDRDIQPNAYVGQLPTPPFSIMVTYRLTEHFKRLWLSMHENLNADVVKKLNAHLNLDLVFHTEKANIEGSIGIEAPGGMSGRNRRQPAGPGDSQ